MSSWGWEGNSSKIQAPVTWVKSLGGLVAWGMSGYPLENKLLELTSPPAKKEAQCQLGMFGLSRQHMGITFQAINVKQCQLWVGSRKEKHSAAGPDCGVRPSVTWSVRSNRRYGAWGICGKKRPLVAFTQTSIGKSQWSPLRLWSKVRASTTKYAPFIKQCLPCCWVTVDKKFNVSRHQVTNYELSDPPNHQARWSKQPFIVRWKWYI